jgi:hypothetical protein
LVRHGCKPFKHGPLLQVCTRLPIHRPKATPFPTWRLTTSHLVKEQSPRLYSVLVISGAIGWAYLNRLF